MVGFYICLQSNGGHGYQLNYFRIKFKTTIFINTQERYVVFQEYTKFEKKVMGTYLNVKDMKTININYVINNNIITHVVYINVGVARL